MQKKREKYKNNIINSKIADSWTDDEQEQSQQADYPQEQYQQQEQTATQKMMEFLWEQVVDMSRKNVEIVKAFIEEGADVNGENTPNEFTPLFHASRYGSDCYGLSKYLLEKGANPNALYHTSTPFLSACDDWADIDLIKTYIKYGADINLPKDNQYNLCSALATLCRTISRRRLLYASLSDKDIEEENENQMEAVKLLLDNGADVNIPDNNGTTPLMTSCEQGTVELIQLLLDYHADTLIKDNNGITALNYATKDSFYGVDKNIVELIKLHTEKQQEELLDKQILQAENPSGFSY